MACDQNNNNNNNNNNSSNNNNNREWWLIAMFREVVQLTTKLKIPQLNLPCSNCFWNTQLQPDMWPKNYWDCSLVLNPGLNRVVSWGHIDCKGDRDHWLHSRPCRCPCRFPQNQWKRPRKVEEAHQDWWPTAGNELLKNYRQHRRWRWRHLDWFSDTGAIWFAFLYMYSYITCLLFGI